jgi:hypothetical protein
MRAWRFRSPAIGEAEVALCPAWTGAEIRAAVGALLRHFEHRLPVDRAARVVIKPNLNNDLVALTGNSVDLRVLDALLTELRARGYTDLTVADGSNVGVERRGINTLERLRVRPLCDRHGVRDGGAARGRPPTGRRHRARRRLPDQPPQGEDARRGRPVLRHEELGGHHPRARQAAHAP